MKVIILGLANSAGRKHGPRNTICVVGGGVGA